MRILLAYDGSQGSQQALALADALALPPGSSIRVVLVVQPAMAALGPAGMPGALIPSPALDEALMAALRADVDAAVRMLGRADRTAEGTVTIGRPASVLLDEATRFRADLAVVGSRGQGPIASLVLGSVSSEISDHAPCPVLVARTPEITTILFATDGSEAAAKAEEMLGSWPTFDGLPIRVVSVADVAAPWHTGIAPMLHAKAAAAHAEAVEIAQAEHSRLAEDAAVRLRAAGRSVETNLRSGDAAGEIISGAEEFGADLIVVGSRGRTGLARLVLGSVARNVLHGSRASVLVVHGPAH